jgi:hypothetical protein
VRDSTNSANERCGGCGAAAGILTDYRKSFLQQLPARISRSGFFNGLSELWHEYTQVSVRVWQYVIARIHLVHSH